VTDATVTEDDERVDIAFQYVTHSLTGKTEKNTTNSSDTKKRQVTLNFDAVFL